MFCDRVGVLLMKSELDTPPRSLLERRYTSQVSMVEGMRAWSVKGVERVVRSVRERLQLEDAGSAEMRKERSDMKRMGVVERILRIVRGKSGDSGKMILLLIFIS